jgi:hypothetical protein
LGSIEGDAAPLFSGPVAGILDADRLEGEVEPGAWLARRRDALDEIPDLLKITAGPFLLEADDSRAVAPLADTP